MRAKEREDKTDALIFYRKCWVRYQLKVEESREELSLTMSATSRGEKGDND